MRELVGQAAVEALNLTTKTAYAYVRQPENIAGLAGALIMPPLVFQRRRPPFLLFLIVAAAGDQVFRMGYRAQRNLQIIADSHADRPDTAA
jgi:hypothetical protein